MQMLWCGLGGVSMTTVTIAAQWPGRHLNTHNGGKLHLRLITHTPRTGDPPLHNLHTCWAKACLHHTNYAYATHRHAFSTQFTCMLSTGVPPAQKLKWQMRSSIKQITHTGVPPSHKLHTTNRRSYLIQIIHTGNPHYTNFTSVTPWCSSMKQITHIDVPPSHKLYTSAFLHDTCSCNTRFKLL